MAAMFPEQSGLVSSTMLFGTLLIPAIAALPFTANSRAAAANRATSEEVDPAALLQAQTSAEIRLIRSLTRTNSTA